MIEIKSLSAREFFDQPNVWHLFREYAQESLIDGFIDPDPSIETYQWLEDMGILHAIGAFVDGKMIGFISILTSAPPHYKQAISNIESFFVSMDYRRSGAGLKLMRAAEDYAKSIGSPVITFSAPVGGKLDRLLDKMNYRHTTNVYMRMFNV